MRDACALDSPACNQPAVYEMDIDRDERWIPLCVEHAPRYYRSCNIRVRTRRTPAADATTHRTGRQER